MGLLTRPRSSVPATIDRLREEFDRALQNWWTDSGEFEEMGASWQPSIDISETEEALEVKADLPGIDPSDVEISVTDDRLTIQGHREEEKESKDKAVHRVERRYGSFYRSIALPTGTDADKVSAVSDNGVITITLPKAPEAKAKRVSVKPK